MKLPCMHLVEISIFSLKNVTVRLTKIMNNLLELLKILIFKVIFHSWKLVKSFQKEPSKNIGLGDQFLFEKLILKYFISWIIYFCPIFVGSVRYFGRFEWHYLVKTCLFPLDAYMVSCPTLSKNLEWYLLWKWLNPPLNLSDRFSVLCTYLWRELRSEKIMQSKY